MIQMKNKENERKNILLGVTGGIAAYKSAELVRLLKKEGFNVKVVMTRNAQRFITPLTMAVLSENKVYGSLFSRNREEEEIRHISLSQWADLMIIAPATANIIAKIAHGISDDLLTSTVLALNCDLILAPAMHTAMLNHPMYQDNVNRLLRLGYTFALTKKGDLACGDYGDGRMEDPDKIMQLVIERFKSGTLLKGKNILITASTTREPIDHVRFISNYSTGKMGFALAEVARNRGGKVTLITGPTLLPDIGRIQMIHVNTAQQMEKQVMAYFDESDIFISAAAVSDFKPTQAFSGKIKKTGRQAISLELERNIDILQEAGKRKNKQLLIGFAAEVDDLVKNALSKLKSKNLDYIVANDISRGDSGFGADTNKVIIIDRKGNRVELPLMSKYKVAEHLFDVVQRSFLDDPDKDIIVS